MDRADKIIIGRKSGGSDGDATMATSQTITLFHIVGKTEHVIAW
jgi:hypothetical protein